MPLYPEPIKQVLKLHQSRPLALVIDTRLTSQSNAKIRTTIYLLIGIIMLHNKMSLPYSRPLASLSCHPFKNLGQGRAPFSVCMPKAAKAMTKVFRVPTKICENIILDIMGDFVKCGGQLGVKPT